MKTLPIIALTVLLTKTSFAQVDTIKVINEKYSQLIYNNDTKSVTQSYNYSNKWDLDGDKRNDSVFFIGNGGAHVFYYPKIILSSNGLTREFPTVKLDMPYFTTIETLEKWKRNPGVQFVVGDFDGDGTQDIYLNFDNSFGSIPKAWRNQGIKT